MLNTTETKELVRNAIQELAENLKDADNCNYYLDNALDYTYSVNYQRDGEATDVSINVLYTVGGPTIEVSFGTDYYDPKFTISWGGISLSYYLERNVNNRLTNELEDLVYQIADKYGVLYI